MSTGLAGKLAAMDNKHEPAPRTTREKREKTTAPPPPTKSRPVAGANRTLTIRHLTDEDLRRLAEFRYTHNLTIQDLAIEGLSLALQKRGLKPLSAYKPEARSDEQGES